MAFPISPTIGQEYTVGTHTYEWNGTAWDIAGSTTASAITDKADITYVDTSINNLNLSGISAITSNVLMSGNLALANYAVTKNFATVTYTGNGGTQSITTGINSVDFTVASNGSGYWLDRATNQVKNDAGVVQASGSCVCNVSKVHIKSRNTAYSHFVTDGIRGKQEVVFTDSTDAETNFTDAITSFDATGFSLNTRAGVNASGATYVAYQTLYTHIKWGTTNQGKFYVEAYNPVTREGMIYYIGSGVAGHEIPHSMGVEIDFHVSKCLTSALNWYTSGKYFNYMSLDSTGANISSPQYVDLTNDNVINISVTQSGYNQLDDKYISYYKCKSENWTIVPYQGSGASGNFIETLDVNGVAKKPRRVILKRTDDVSDWLFWDSERGVSTSRLSLNVANAEVVAEYIEFKPDGFEPVSSGVTNNWINASGGQYIAIVEFDTNGNGGDSYFDLPTDDSNLNVTAGTFTYTNGIGSNGYERSAESYTGAIDFTGMSDGLKWIAKIEGGGFVAYDKKPSLGLYDKTSADDNRLVFNTEDGKYYTTTGGELFNADGYTASNTTVTVFDDNTVQIVDNTGAGYAEWIIPTVAGKTYRFVLNTMASREAYFLLDGSPIVSYVMSGTYTGERTVDFIATSTSHTLKVSDGSSHAYTVTISASIYKLEPTLDTALTTPVSFLPNPIMVASETPMDIRYDDVLSQNVAESVEAKTINGLENLLGDDSHSITGNGYQKLSNGLILQWGSVTVGANSAATVTLPITFPTLCASITAHHGAFGQWNVGGNWSTMGGVNIVSTSQIQIYNKDDASGTYYWFAVGY